MGSGQASGGWRERQKESLTQRPLRTQRALRREEEEFTQRAQRAERREHGEEKADPSTQSQQTALALRSG
jgi:hypothetical protein